MPHRKGEQLADYCQRLLPQIDQDRPFIFIGVSFGGAVAVELSRLCKPQLVVLVSSVPLRESLPAYMRWSVLMMPAKMAEVLPYAWAPLVEAALAAAFAPVDIEGRKLLYDQIQKTDATFLSWAIGALMRWNNAQKPDNMLHIHGSADRLLPLRYVKADVVIKGGGHFIIFSHGAEIGRIIDLRLKVETGASP